MNKKRVLIIDDSPLFTQLITSIVSGSEGFEVCAGAEDAYKAAAAIEKLKPDMLILDVELPMLGGDKFLRKLLPQYAVPVIACTSRKDMAAAMLAAGAADFVLKPSGGELETFKHQLKSAMVNASNIREVTCDGVVYKLRRSAEQKRNDERLILIGGSAGSTEALPVILREFDKSIPPIAVTLHMPAGYTNLYAARLSKQLDIEFVEARDGMALRSGCAVIAEGSKHMRIAAADSGGFIVRSTTGEKISGHCPSVDALFASAAKFDAKKMTAVMLTGMGYDGADGMLRLRHAGAYTIGQDEKTSVVYGMPREAFEIGAVMKQCALENIAAAVKQRLKEMNG